MADPVILKLIDQQTSLLLISAGDHRICIHDHTGQPVDLTVTGHYIYFGNIEELEKKPCLN